MKTLASRLTVLLVLGLTLPGCRVLMDKHIETPIQAPPLKVTQKVTPVQPEELSPANAKSKAQQLLDEMEQDAGKVKE